MLIREIRSNFGSEDEITMIGTNSLKYQTAVINESMRWAPAGPETTRRITNKGGNVICGEFVPGGVSPLFLALIAHFVQPAERGCEQTLVGTYAWAAGHYNGAWKDTNSFVPERWLGDKRYEGDARGVSNVWNAGPRNCLGQKQVSCIS